MPCYPCGPLILMSRRSCWAPPEECTVSRGSSESDPPSCLVFFRLPNDHSQEVLSGLGFLGSLNTLVSF